jgi:hypothetical protein
MLSGSEMQVYRFESFNKSSNIPSVPAGLKISKRERAEVELANRAKPLPFGNGISQQPQRRTKKTKDGC